MHNFSDKLIAKAELLGSLKLFTEFFYKQRTGRDFIISDPIGRESHYLIIFKELVKVLRLETNRLIINVPPGHGKSTILQHFVAWALAHYPDSQFLYISYASALAEKHTGTIKQIMEMSEYRKYFDVHLDQSSSAKGHFKTTHGGTVIAFGSTGSITGQDAGLPNLHRFSGGVIIDDAHKPDEVHSDKTRESVINNYKETIKPRPRGENVPIVFLGQRLHEADLASYLIKGEDGFTWKKVILKSIDEAGNVLCPNINSLAMLRREQETNPYVFSSQYQQDPQPAGGGIFKKEWFQIHDHEPKVLSTFITCDTAETEKEWNDATVFSFFGIYKVKIGDIDSDVYALHWLDCIELRVEPKDLKTEFFNFYSNCLKYKVKPSLVAIEKKSTGTTLISELKQYQGLQVYEIERTRAQGSKISRFLEIQPYIARKLISFTDASKHSDFCIEHMRKITANDSHRFDDIADTLADGIKLALIDKIVINRSVEKQDHEETGKQIYSHAAKIDKLRKAAYGN